ncbi:tyrosine-type recombinase/integrase [Amycolatopsis nivea]|uniref:tyrosine-type recombinase/integrase n=1 Tax=Amycolatopsis nivea TaxID=1644109 RepID=UPI001F0DF3E7|nr:tyrosine-type recombinase/integrase [Amycolatopsis nivea]
MIKGANFTYDVWRPAFAGTGHDNVERRDGMHAMRHFFASTMLANGVSIKEVAEHLGHHDPGYTLRIEHAPRPVEPQAGPGGHKPGVQARWPQGTAQDSVTA